MKKKRRAAPKKTRAPKKKTVQKATGLTGAVKTMKAAAKGIGAALKKLTRKATKGQR